MPWCEACERFLNPTSLTVAGACPTCGRLVGERPADGASEPGAGPRAPWHFKLLLVALVIYLAFRAIQGALWVVQHV